MQLDSDRSAFLRATEILQNFVGNSDLNVYKHTQTDTEIHKERQREETNTNTHLEKEPDRETHREKSKENILSVRMW